MPELDDICRAWEIGLSGRGGYVWTACWECGKERWVALVAGEPQFRLCISCSRKIQFRDRTSHPSWRGGRFVASGYVFIRLQADDPFFPMADSHNAVREHRLVMAKHLGRCLQPWELVHHKGTKYPAGSAEDKLDNRIENLQLLDDQKYHIVDSVVKSRVTRLEALVEEQAKQIRFLSWQIRESKDSQKEENKSVR